MTRRGLNSIPNRRARLESKETMTSAYPESNKSRYSHVLAMPESLKHIQSPRLLPCTKRTYTLEVGNPKQFMRDGAISLVKVYDML